MRPTRRFLRPTGHSTGMTLVELMVTTLILATVILIVTRILLTTSNLHTRTARRAEVQMQSRQGLSLMVAELRQAGTDPGDPPIGLVAIVEADTNRIRVRADVNGDRAIQTTEPSEDVTFSYDSTARAVFRDPGSGRILLIPNVTAMTFTYFDGANQPLTALPLNATDAARVRSVGITLTSVDRDSPPITLNTRISLRNV